MFTLERNDIMPTYKDTDKGTYYCKFYYVDWMGQRRQKLKRGFPRSKDAKAWERDFLQKQQGSSDMTFKSLVDLYLEDIAPRNKESSIYVKKALINAWLLPTFDNRPINEITPVEVRKWQSELMKGRDGKKISKTHIINIEKTFSAIMNFAVKYYKLPFNPQKELSFSPEKKKMDFWTKDEFLLFHTAVKDPIAYMAFEVLFYTGIRVGELLALNKKDIDFVNGLISITKTYSPKNKGEQITAPKTPNSYRTVTIPTFLCEHLQKYILQFYDLNSNDRLFPVLPDWLRRRLTKGCNISGVKTIRIHDIRHSHVSMLIDMGFSAHLIAERIGDTVDMVNNVYGHLYPNRHAEVANKLQDIVSF